MGDRTWGQLEIFGEIRRDLIPQLVEELADPNWTEADFTDGADILIECEQVNYGSIENAFDGDVQGFLEEHGISYCWAWGDGGDYGPGVTVWTPDFSGDFDTNRSEICIGVSDLAYPDRIEAAKKAQAIWSANAKIKLVDPAPPASAA